MNVQNLNKISCTTLILLLFCNGFQQVTSTIKNHILQRGRRGFSFEPIGELFGSSRISRGEISETFENGFEDLPSINSKITGGDSYLKQIDDDFKTTNEILQSLKRDEEENRKLNEMVRSAQEQEKVWGPYLQQLEKNIVNENNRYIPQTADDVVKANDFVKSIEESENDILKHVQHDEEEADWIFDEDSEVTIDRCPYENLD